MSVKGNAFSNCLFFIACNRNENSTLESSQWKLVGSKTSVDRDMASLKAEFPTEYDEMESLLQSMPETEIRGKLIQMRLEPRVREYKLTHDIRVLFVLDFEQRRVIVTYAGQHLNKRRTDQKLRQIRKKH